MVISWCQNTEILTDMKIIMVAWQSNPGCQDPIPMIRNSVWSLDVVFLLRFYFHACVSFQMIVVGNIPRQAMAKLCKILADWMQTHSERARLYIAYFVERCPECLFCYPLPWALGVGLRSSSHQRHTHFHEFSLCPHLCFPLSGVKHALGLSSDWGWLLFL